MNTNSDLLEPQFPQDAYIQMTRVGVHRILLFCSMVSVVPLSELITNAVSLAALGPVHPQHKLFGLPVSSVGRFGPVPFHSTGNC